MASKKNELKLTGQTIDGPTPLGGTKWAEVEGGEWVQIDSQNNPLGKPGPHPRTPVDGGEPGDDDGEAGDEPKEKATPKGGRKAK